MFAFTQNNCLFGFAAQLFWWCKTCNFCICFCVYCVAFCACWMCALTLIHCLSVLMCSAGQSMNRWSLEEMVKRDPENSLILLQQIIRKTKEVRKQRLKVEYIVHSQLLNGYPNHCSLSVSLNVCVCSCVSSGSGAVSVWAGGSARHHVFLHASSGTDHLMQMLSKPLTRGFSKFSWLSANLWTQHMTEGNIGKNAHIMQNNSKTNNFFISQKAHTTTTHYYY